MQFIGQQNFPSPIKAKFEYNNLGELIPMQNPPAGYSRQQDVNIGKNQPYYQNTGTNKNEDYMARSKINNEWHPSDKPNRVAYDPKHYYKQAQHLYGSSLQVQPEQTSVKNPFIQASQGVLNRGEKGRDTYSERRKLSSIDSPYQQERKEQPYQDLNSKNAQSSQFRHEMNNGLLRFDYANQNLRTHIDLTSQPNEIINPSPKKPINDQFIRLNSLVVKQDQVERNINLFLANDSLKMPSKNSQFSYRVNTLRSLERDNRQYGLSQNDSIESMKERSKQFRTLKEILLNSRDPQQAPLLRKAVERRVLAKARQEERKNKLVALLGLDSFSASNQAYLLNRNH